MAQRILEEDVKTVEELQKHSIQSRADDTADVGTGGTVGGGLLTYLIRSGELIPPWWSVQRDIELRKFVMKSDHLSGSLSLLASKVINVPVEVQPRDTALKSHIKQADEYNMRLHEESEFGQTWIDLASKWLADYWCTDSGGYMEVIGDGKADGPIKGPALGLAHLDSTRCQRKKDSEYPVSYTDEDGYQYKLHRTRVAYASDMPSSIVEMRGVGFCLHGDSTVMMGNGRHERIMDVVRDFSTETVRGVNDSGDLVDAKIMGWHKSPLLGRRLINIRGQKSKVCRGAKERNSWVTEDHKILTPDGWKPASELRNGDKVITVYPSPNHKQMEFLIGTLMGDGSMPPSRTGNGSPSLLLGHSKAQEEWFDIKVSIIEEDFGFRKRHYDYKLKYKGKTKVYPGVSGYTRVHPGFFDLSNAFYPEGKKVFPEKLIREYFSPLMLATWYLDDGYICDREPGPKNRRPHARISTGSRSQKELEFLCNLLTEMGYAANTISARGQAGRKDIRITTEGSCKFFEDIAPYVPPSMRYKIPREAKEYNSSLWDLGRAERLVDKVEVKEWDKKQPEPRHVYCIDVEEVHNFATAGIVVHNCAISRTVNTAQNLIDESIYRQEKLGSRPFRGIMFTPGIPTDVVQSTLEMASEIMDNQGLSRFAKIPVLGGGDTNARFELVSLSSLPDGFDEETSTRLGMFAIALAFGVPIRWIWPAATSGATKADAMYQHIAGLGGGVGRVLKTLTYLLGGDPRGSKHTAGKFLPPHLKLVFDFQDDEQDRMQAEIREKRMGTIATALETGVYTLRVAREKELEAGDITQAQFNAMELAEGRLPSGEDVLTLFYASDDSMREMLDLGVPDALDVTSNDPEQILTAIEEKMGEARESMSSAGSPSRKEMTKQAMAALNKLRDTYQEAAKKQAGELPTSGDEPSAHNEAADSESDDQAQEDRTPTDSEGEQEPEEVTNEQEEEAEEETAEEEAEEAQASKASDEEGLARRAWEWLKGGPGSGNFGHGGRPGQRGGSSPASAPSFKMDPNKPSSWINSDDYDGSYDEWEADAKNYMEDWETDFDSSDFDFATTCVNSDGTSIGDMVSLSEDIDRNEFLDHVEPETMRMLEEELGYSDDGLRMEDDWSVSYGKSMYRGVPAYYFVNSAIEYVFVSPDWLEQTDINNPNRKDLGTGFKVWSSLSDAPTHLRTMNGASLSLAQINHLARIADGLERDSTVDNAWAVARAQFKKLYGIEGDEWVKRKKKPLASKAWLSLSDTPADLREIDNLALSLDQINHLARLVESIETDIGDSETAKRAARIQFQRLYKQEGLQWVPRKGTTKKALDVFSSALSSVSSKVSEWLKGGPGSGHHSHRGVPGQRGGSAPGSPVNVDSAEFKAWFGDSKIVDANGQPRVLYHQTSKKSETGIYSEGFDLNRPGARASDDRVPDGVFLKSSDTDIGLGAVDKEDIAQIPLYVRMENPLEVKTTDHLTAMFREDEGWNEIAFESYKIEREMKAKFDEWDSWWKGLPADQKQRGTELANKNFRKKMDGQGEVLKEWRAKGNEAATRARARATVILREMGYDGVIILEDIGSWGRVTDTFIVFDPVQIKSALLNEGAFDRSDPRITKSLTDKAREGIGRAVSRLKGGVGSGNWGHQGRPGERGGSAPSATSGLQDIASTSTQITSFLKSNYSDEPEEDPGSASWIAPDGSPLAWGEDHEETAVMALQSVGVDTGDEWDARSKMVKEYGFIRQTLGDEWSVDIPDSVTDAQWRYIRNTWRQIKGNTSIAWDYRGEWGSDWEGLRDRILLDLESRNEEVKGGVGSGNFGHSGRPGKRGGSAPSDSSPSTSLKIIGDIPTMNHFDTRDFNTVKPWLGKTAKSLHFASVDEAPTTTISGKEFRVAGEWDRETDTMTVYGGSGDNRDLGSILLHETGHALEQKFRNDAGDELYVARRDHPEWFTSGSRMKPEHMEQFASQFPTAFLRRALLQAETRGENGITHYSRMAHADPRIDGMSETFAEAFKIWARAGSRNLRGIGLDSDAKFAVDAMIGVFEKYASQWGIGVIR